MKDFDNQDHKLKKSPEEVEDAIVRLFANIYSRTVEEISKKYGEEGFKLAKKACIDSMVESSIEDFKKMDKKDIKTYINWLLRIITVGHRYEIIENKKDSVRFKFTNCPWATAFRDIGKPEIGKFFCEADKPLVEAFNNNIKFEITKTLMDGDDYCNHHYYIKKPRL
ncbi:MAG: L-2-amino-thiazoline-4-carboxylic acid hydrolase [Actinomycetia bacterium]|nr:L-2-amino-thiazoline-4-carboxylic acid hydrolase [Actinomycetes bacterium]